MRETMTPGRVNARRRGIAIPDCSKPQLMMFQPERVWQYQDQDGVHEMSEHDIIREMYPWWAKQMMKVGLPELISPENCIQDFVVVHWASVTKEE